MNNAKPFFSPNMSLINFPKVRVKQYPQGFAVEMRKGFIFKRWKHIISVSGMHDKPWYYLTKEAAINSAKKYFEWELLNERR